MKKRELKYFEMRKGHFDLVKGIWERTDGIKLTIGDTEDEFGSYLKRNKGMSFICKDGRIIVGTILCGHDGRRGFIYHLAVHKDYRRRKIADKLIKLSLKQLRTHGLKRCMLMADNINESAKSFWTKMKWRKRDDLQMFSIDL
ncbi:MAG: GNAT family N-acetyltransferase [Ignavibacteria bacterium]|nr:GNAT family N-acetyltransferase [Ignavibacteria bacterium]